MKPSGRLVILIYDRRHPPWLKVSCFLKSYVQGLPDLFLFVFLFLDVAQREALRDLPEDDCEGVFSVMVLKVYCPYPWGDYDFY